MANIGHPENGAAVLDYHLHLWPHGERDRQPTVEQLAEFCAAAEAHGVVEIALTEHLFRFGQADAICRGFWEEDPDGDLAREMAAYWDAHAHADLDCYVDTVVAAKQAGLPVILGLEVDYYRGRMDKVAALLDGYPFDVLLGSVHWIGAWGFDDLDSQVVMAEWDRRDIEVVWDAYTEALEELASSGACDVLAHPDLVKICGRYPRVPEEFYDRMASAAAASGMAAELSSAGWRKPVGEQYPAPALLERLVRQGVGLTTASDSHGVSNVGQRSVDLRAILSGAGVVELTGFRERTPYPVVL